MLFVGSVDHFGARVHSGGVSGQPHTLFTQVPRRSVLGSSYTRSPNSLTVRRNVLSLVRRLPDRRVARRECRLPIFRFDKVMGMARGAKAFLRTHLKGHTAPAATAHPERREARAGGQEEARQRAREQQKQISAKKHNAKRELA